MSLVRRLSLVLLITAPPCWVSAASAFDGTDVSSQDAKSAGTLSLFKNPSQAFRQGMDGYRSGNFKTSVEAFEYAAANGNPLARWKLGRMYASGDGVPQDDDKAYRYFSQIVNNYDEEDGDRRDLSVVSNAFVAVGVYSLNGLPRTGVKADPERALEMFQYAALNFGNADAQYNLARLYLDGADGTVVKDPRQAVRWLALAADKGHLQAQALLGHMLFNGFDGMPPQRAKGLMWLTMARDAALQGKDPKDAWIVDLCGKATSSASDSDRQVALLYLDEHHKRN
ncbi:MAG: tetratricopeptide repeat protein [Janthinobacterium lividum]